MTIKQDPNVGYDIVPRKKNNYPRRNEALLSCTDRKPIYFPSFEIVRWVGGHAGNAFGDDGLPRHISQQYVKEIIASFLAAGEGAST